MIEIGKETSQDKKSEKVATLSDIAAADAKTIGSNLTTQGTREPNANEVIWWITENK